MNKIRDGWSTLGSRARWIAVTSVVFVVGAVAASLALETTTSDPFCLSCHEMAENIAGERTATLLLEASDDLHAECSACHVPKPFMARIRRKLRASTELYHHLAGTINTPERFEARRMQMATRVWSDIRRNDSAECTNCHHGNDWNLEEQGVLARKFHERAEATGTECTGCHKGIAHDLTISTSDELPYSDADACDACHEAERTNFIWQTSHSNPQGDDASNECNDCHTSGIDHLSFPLENDNIHLDAENPGKRVDTSAQTSACVACHEEGPTASWRVDPHRLHDTPCTACHIIHGEGDAEASRPMRDFGCADSCHNSLETAPPSLADTAVGDAEANCIDCHNPHQIRKDRPCLSCHLGGSESRGEESPEARDFHHRWGAGEEISCGRCHMAIIHEIPHHQLAEVMEVMGSRDEH